MTEQPQTDIPRVFISHAWEDNNLTKQVADRLIKAGAEVRVDVSSFRAGELLIDNIEAALKWCNTLVVLWSAAASNSKWVQKEIAIAEEMKEEKRIICCALDDTEPRPILRIRIYIKFDNFEQGIGQLIHDLGLTRKSVRAVNKKGVAFHNHLVKTPIQLRSQPLTNYSVENLKKMLKDKNFFHEKFNRVDKGKNHQYEIIESYGTKMVFDKTTGLTWRQSESELIMHFDAIDDEYLQKLNYQQDGGYNDWRLPTLEEAMSLVESRQYDKFFVDKVFQFKYGYFWTADKGGHMIRNKYEKDEGSGEEKIVDKERIDLIWIADFRSGYCFTTESDDDNPVLAVR